MLNVERAGLETGGGGGIGIAGGGGTELGKLEMTERGTANFSCCGFVLVDLVEGCCLSELRNAILTPAGRVEMDLVEVADGGLLPSANRRGPSLTFGLIPNDPKSYFSDWAGRRVCDDNLRSAAGSSSCDRIS